MIIDREDTIAAISTPPGEGGIAVVRISGKAACALADNIFHGRLPVAKMPTHTVHFGQIREPRVDQMVDEVLLTVMREPNSYTGEDVVEVSSHGSPLVAQKILSLLIQCGARLAQPGEFTLRAFLNGRLDLAQAEAVADLISAKTELSLRTAAEQLSGRLSQTINDLGEKLIELLALLEAYTDFPEEDLNLDDNSTLATGLQSARAEIARLIATYNEGKIIRQGLRVPIIGKPNVGKSSLFNRLLDENRAIVHEIPGTTRDTVAEYINLAGLPIELIDTAGLRESNDPVEQEGIKRTRLEIEKADLVLALIDANCENCLEEIEVIERTVASVPTIVLANKADLLGSIDPALPPAEVGNPPLLYISARTGDGMVPLKEQIITHWKSRQDFSSKGEIIITNLRHLEALKLANQYIEKVAHGLGEKRSYEFLAFDLRKALEALELIIGRTTPDEILDRIFSRFCIGK